MFKSRCFQLTLYAPNPKIGQTHSKTSSVTADKLFVFDHFVGFALKGLAISGQ